jgi:hypothetical protein
MEPNDWPVSPGHYYHVDLLKAGDQRLPRVKAFDPSEHYVDLSEDQSAWLEHLITCEILKGRLSDLPASLMVTLSEDGEPQFTWKPLPPR